MVHPGQYLKKQEKREESTASSVLSSLPNAHFFCDSQLDSMAAKLDRDSSRGAMQITARMLLRSNCKPASVFVQFFTIYNTRTNVSQLQEKFKSQGKSPGIKLKAYKDN
jgi:hypothetical protein